MPTRIGIHYGVIITIHKDIKPLEGVGIQILYIIRTNEPPYLGIVVAALEVIEARLVVVDVAAVAEGTQGQGAVDGGVVQVDGLPLQLYGNQKILSQKGFDRKNVSCGGSSQSLVFFFLIRFNKTYKILTAMPRSAMLSCISHFLLLLSLQVCLPKECYTPFSEACTI